MHADGRYKNVNRVESRTHSPISILAEKAGDEPVKGGTGIEDKVPADGDAVEADLPAGGRARGLDMDLAVDGRRTVGHLGLEAVEPERGIRKRSRPNHPRR